MQNGNMNFSDIAALITEDDKSSLLCNSNEWIGDTDNENQKTIKNGDIFDLGLILLECALGGLDLFIDEEIQCGGSKKSKHLKQCCCVVHCSRLESKNSKLNVYKFLQRSKYSK